VQHVTLETFQHDGDLRRLKYLNSHGQWGGYRTTKAVAWVISIAPGQWLTRCRDEASGPSPFNEAKANAFAMAKGGHGDYLIENSIDHLNGLAARLLGRDDSEL
jgi:hypothetical protein